MSESDTQEVSDGMEAKGQAMKHIRELTIDELISGTTERLAFYELVTRYTIVLEEVKAWRTYNKAELDHMVPRKSTKERLLVVARAATDARVPDVGGAGVFPVVREREAKGQAMTSREIAEKIVTDAMNQCDETAMEEAIAAALNKAAWDGWIRMEQFDAACCGSGHNAAPILAGMKATYGPRIEP